MAAPKKTKTTAKKSAPKAKPTATKTAAKPAAKKTVTAKALVPKAVAKPTSKAQAAAVRPAPQLHSVPQAPRSNPPAPQWVENAIAYAQANPAVTLVSIIAVVVGIMLIFS